MKEKHARYWWATSILDIIDAEGEKSDRKKVNDLLEKARKSIGAGRRLAPELRWKSLEERMERVHPPVG
jgi:predicted ArsR family transcriptional regulator